MPIVMVHAFAPADPSVVPRMLVEVRDAGARAFACAASNIWVMFLPLAPGAYVQGEVHTEMPATHERGGPRPPVVVIKAQLGRSDAERERLVRAISEVVGRALGVNDDDVWIHYESMRPQDVWYGSRWAG